MNKGLKKKLSVSCTVATLVLPVVINSTEAKAFGLQDVAQKLVDNFFDYDDKHCGNCCASKRPCGWIYKGCRSCCNNKYGFDFD